ILSCTWLIACSVVCLRRRVRSAPRLMRLLGILDSTCRLRQWGITEPVIQRDEKTVALTTRVRIASPAKWSVPSNAELALLRGTLGIVSMANDEDSGISLWYRGCCRTMVVRCEG
ncbi:uncharacterized protein F5147DRAFT_713463, partial [Suillus discolor]